MKFTKKQMAAYGLGAVGKDMVYALSSGYVLYYYQDILGMNAAYLGLILLIARIFDAANDPFMGILVAKTNSKWGRFRPWLLSGSILNAFVLYALFSAPNISDTGLKVFFAIIYILWGVTYTMMDIPFWSMIPAVTKEPKDREQISVVGRTCAGVGNALIQIGLLPLVQAIGGGVDHASERVGFSYAALIVSILFVIFEVICVMAIKEKNTSDEHMETTTVREMFHSLFHNDQAMVVVITIILVNTALYITSNLLIYFFKYDVGGTNWAYNNSIFNTVGGASQILGMMIVYPLLRKAKIQNEKIFKGCLCSEILGYALILISCLTGISRNIAVDCVCGLFVFLANGIITVLTTVYLSASVDYGELKTGKREESVIFSMQTFVVKLASGVAIWLASNSLGWIGMKNVSSAEGTAIEQQSAATLRGLESIMTIVPIVILIVSYIVFQKKFKMSDDRIEEMSLQLSRKHAGDEQNA